MDKFDKYIEMVESRLYSVFPQEELPQRRVIEACGYSLSAGGKRVRPALTLAFCEMCGGDPENAVDAACAVEYMHTYSLIHDDLPCMDNDDLRRGKPSCHKAYDEATALLAGDALAILPFETIAGSRTIPPEAAMKCIRELSHCCGVCGMIGGQQIDVENVGKGVPGELIVPMYSMKTSALIRAACVCGVYCAQSTDEERLAEKAAEYAENLGLAFQIVDDILDVTSSDEVLGKHAGIDAELGKQTYVQAFGIDKAEDAAGEYTKKAVDALAGFENNDTVKRFTLTLLGRKN